MLIATGIFTAERIGVVDLNGRGIIPLDVNPGVLVLEITAEFRGLF
jgi:hypothetical protein